MREHIGLRGVRREMAHICRRGVEVISVDVGQIVVARDAGAARYQRSGETVWINGVQWTVTWTTVTNWIATVPLAQGSNGFSVVGFNSNDPVHCLASIRQGSVLLKC